MNKPVVSAIVSTYNSAKFFEGKINDLVNQTIFDKTEIIVINSGSEEDEDELIQKFLEKYDNIKYLKTEKETVYQTWNRGIKLSSGIFITNANTDDRLRGDAFEVLSDYLIKHPKVCLVYADQYLSEIPNETYAQINKRKLVKQPDFNYLVQLERSLVFSQPMWRSSLHFEDNYWFNEKYEICSDHEFQLKISLNCKMHHLAIPLGTFYKSPSNDNKSFKNRKKVYREKKEITYNYIFKYLRDLDKGSLNNLKKKFSLFVKLPIPVLLLILNLKKKIFPNRFTFSLEFIYLFMAAIYNRLGEKDKAKKVCIKILNKKELNRIQKFYDTL